MYDGAEAPRAKPSSLFDWIFVAVCAWMVGGAYLDGWAHTHIAQLESFFTPWHAVLYAGFAAQASFLAGSAFLNHRHGDCWRHSLPGAYRLSLLGSAIFLAGGAADMIWHVLFGIEANVDALLSPTHLILALGAALIVTGPLRAAEARIVEGHRFGHGIPRKTRWLGAVALALLLNLFTFFTQYAHPWVQQLPSLRHWTNVEDVVFYRQALGVTSILLQSSILIGILLYGQRRWTLPVGGITVILGLNAISMALMRDRFDMVPGAVFAAIIADAVAVALRNKPKRLRIRLLAFGLPLLLYAFYFLTLLLEGGLWWSVHLVAGSVALAGLSGLLLTLIAGPQTQAVDGQGIETKATS